MMRENILELWYVAILMIGVFGLSEYLLACRRQMYCRFRIISGKLCKALVGLIALLQFSFLPVILFKKDLIAILSGNNLFWLVIFLCFIANFVFSFVVYYAYSQSGEEKPKEDDNNMKMSETDIAEDFCIDKDLEADEDGIEAYGLSHREQEILELLRSGKSNNEIADELCIALSTVKNHISSIYNKLGVNRRVQAVQFIKEFEQHNKTRAI